MENYHAELRVTDNNNDNKNEQTRSGMLAMTWNHHPIGAIRCLLPEAKVVGTIKGAYS